MAVYGGRLPSGPARKTFIQKGLYAFVPVGRAAKVAKDSGFAVESLIERQIESFIHSTQNGLDGKRSVRCDFKGKRLGACHHGGCRHNFVDEPDTQRLGRVNNGPGEQQPERRATADEPGQPLRASIARDNTELDLGLAKLGRFCRDPEGAGHGQLATAAESKTLNAGDDRLAHGFDAAKDRLTASGKVACGIGREVGEFAHVGAGGKSSVDPRR